MAQDPLIAALEEDARGQAARILEEAGEAREALLRESREDARKEAEERLSEARERLGKEKAARLNAARTKAAGMKLVVRQELVQKAVDEARSRLFSLKGEERLRLIERLYAELQSDWSRTRGNEPPIVRVNPVDERAIQANGAKVHADDSVLSGIVFTSEDGRVRFENTVSSRMERAKKNMIPAINEMLFDEVLS